MRLNRLFLLTVLSMVLTARLYAQFTGKTPGRTTFFNAPPPESTSDSRIDVKWYHLDYQVDPEVPELSGTCRVLIQALGSDLNDVILNARDNLTIDSLSVSGADFVRDGDDVRISLGQTLQVGDTLTLEFSLHLCGSHEDYGGVYFQNYSDSHPLPVAWSLTEPWGSAAWFVCKDDPADKADSVRVDLRVPEGYRAVSNGDLSGIETLADGWQRFSWRERYPIATYLVFLAIADYVSWDEVCRVDGELMPLHYHVYPGLYEQAQQDFQDLPRMVEYFSELFGPYPFAEHGYGMVTIKGWTAMEHQTCTSYGQNFIWGNNHYDSVIAHELGHQWFGDLVTCATWPDLWLNESFATWSDALWAGRNSHEDYLFRLREMRQEIDDQRDFIRCLPTYPSPEDTLFSPHTYQRGAWILHMISELAGRENFLEGVNRYLDQMAWGAANTDTFLDIVFADLPGGLREIFYSWLTAAGLPEYEFGWDVRDDGKGWLAVRPYSLPCRGSYLTPLTVRVYESGMAHDLFLLLDEDVRRLEWQFPVPTDSIRLDPQEILAADFIFNPDAESWENTTDEPAQLLVFPNPAGEHVEIRVSDWDELHVFDILGHRKYARIRRWEAGGTILTVDVSTWAAGVYLVDLETGGQHQYQRLLVLR